MKRIIFVILIINFLLFGNTWQEEVKKEFSIKGAIQYGKIIELLKKNYKESSDSDIKIPVLLSYSYMKLGEKDQEVFWIKEYFERYNGNEIKGFGLKQNREIYLFDFLDRWKEKYPGVKNIYLIKKEYEYKKEPKYLEIKLILKNICKYNLSNKIINKNGFFKKGENILKMIEGKNSLIVKNGVFEIKKIINIKKTIDIPEKLELKNGHIKLKGKEFKKEYLEKTEVKTIKKFDKKKFLKSSLTPGLIGIGSIVINRFTFDKNSNKYPSSRGLSIGVDVFGIAMVVKGIKSYFSCIKKRKEKVINREKVKGAQIYNMYLKSLIKKERKKIKVRYTVKIGENK